MVRKTLNTLAEKFHDGSDLLPFRGIKLTILFDTSLVQNLKFLVAYENGKSFRQCSSKCLLSQALILTL